MAEDLNLVSLEAVWLQNLYLRLGRGQLRSPTRSPGHHHPPTALPNSVRCRVGSVVLFSTVTGPSDCPEPTSPYRVPWQDCPGTMTSPSMWSPRRWSASPGFASQSPVQGTGRHPFTTALAQEGWWACGLPDGWREGGGKWPPRSAA